MNRPRTLRALVAVSVALLAPAAVATVIDLDRLDHGASAAALSMVLDQFAEVCAGWC